MIVIRTASVKSYSQSKHTWQVTRITNTYMNVGAKRGCATPTGWCAFIKAAVRIQTRDRLARRQITAHLSERGLCAPVESARGKPLYCIPRVNIHQFVYVNVAYIRYHGTNITTHACTD